MTNRNQQVRAPAEPQKSAGAFATNDARADHGHSNGSGQSGSGQSGSGQNGWPTALASTAPD